MAVGRFVDFAPLPQGGYQFQLDDGSPFVATGPEADGLAQALARSKAMGPQPIAGPPVPGALGIEDAGAQMSVPDAGMTPAPMAPYAAPPAAPGFRMDKVPVTEAKYGRSKEGVPAGIQAPPPPAPAAPGNPTQDYLFRPEYVPGRAGISREQLEQRAQQGVAMPRGGEITREGGYPVDPQFLESQRELSVDRRMNAQNAADTALEQARAGWADAIGEQARQNAELQKQQTIERDITERVTADRANLQKTRAEYRASRVEPNRLFREAGVAATIGAALSVGLGAFGSAMTGSRNFAQDIIDSAIERDIRSQEQEIQLKGEAANNALSDLVRSTGSLDQARSALRIVQHDYAQSLRATTAAAARAPEIQQAAQEWDLGEQQKLLEFEERYVRESFGKHSERVMQEMAYPVAATAGGYRAPSERTIQARAKTLGDIQGLDKGEAETDLTRAQAAKAAREAVDGPKPENAQDFARSRQSVDSAIDNAVSIARKYGYDVDPQTGEVKPATGSAGFPARGAQRIVGLPNNAEHVALRSELSAFGSQYARAANGGTSEPTPALIEALTPDPTGTDEAIRQQLQSGIQRLFIMRRNVNASGTPELRTRREEQRQEVNREAAGLPTQGGPTAPAAMPAQALPPARPF